VWLQRQGRYLEQFSAEKARSKFNKFVLQWNAGTLTPDFYKGMDRTAVPEKLSKHRWKFKNVSSDEVAVRETTRDTVDTFTKAKGGENLALLGPIAFRQAAESKSLGLVGPDRVKGPVGPSLDDRANKGRDEIAPRKDGDTQLRGPQLQDKHGDRCHEARVKEEARMASFKAQMAPFLNFQKS